MSGGKTWRELMRTDRPDHARSVAASIAAMEFPVRVVDLASPPHSANARDASGGSWSPTSIDALNTTKHADAHDDFDGDHKIGPLAIEVRDEHWGDLTDVLADLIDEQTEFDAALEHRDRGERRIKAALGLLIILGAAMIVVLRALHQ